MAPTTCAPFGRSVERTVGLDPKGARMKITFARVGLLALAVTLASLAPLLGRARRSAALEFEGGDGPISYDSLVFVDQWLASAGMDSTRRELG